MTLTKYKFNTYDELMAHAKEFTPDIVQNNMFYPKLSDYAKVLLSLIYVRYNINIKNDVFDSQGHYIYLSHMDASEIMGVASNKIGGYFDELTQYAFIKEPVKFGSRKKIYVHFTL